MPRTGITEPQIMAAIEALQGRGEPVSKITVRKELGDTGSYGTISAFLQRWKAQREQEAPEEAGPVPESVQALFAKAWSVAQGQAQAELAPQREALAQAQAELKAELQRAQAENDEAVRILEVQLEHQAAQLAEVAAKDQATQHQLAKLAEQLGYAKAKWEAAEAAATAASQRLQDSQVRVAELEAGLTKAEGLEHKAGHSRHGGEA
jgi:hypothetical protein